jgi:hypothetical protein
VLQIEMLKEWKADPANAGKEPPTAAHIIFFYGDGGPIKAIGLDGL